jgi:hypothetical protein
METEHEGMVLLDRILENNPTWSPKGSRVDPTKYSKQECPRWKSDMR